MKENYEKDTAWITSYLGLMGIDATPKLVDQFIEKVAVLNKQEGLPENRARRLAANLLVTTGV